MTSMKTRRASLRSASNVVPSGRSRIAVAAPGVVRETVAFCAPPIRQLAVSVPEVNVPTLKLKGGCKSEVPVSGDCVATSVLFKERETWSQLLYTRTVVGDVDVH